MPTLAWAARFFATELAYRVAKTIVACVLGALLALSASYGLGTLSTAVVRARPANQGGFVVLPPETILGPSPNQPAVSATAVGSMGASTVGLLQASATQAPCIVDWAVLAGTATIEDSGYGAKPAIGAAIALKTGLVIHAYGPAQMLIPTWNIYGDQPIQRGFTGNLEQAPPAAAYIWQPAHAYPALARYLCTLGVASDPVAALWAYSGCVPEPGCARADNYPFHVLALAAKFAVLDKPTPNPLASQILGEAKTWLGTRYVFGGTTRNGVDCSALVMLVYRTAGVNLPAPSQRQYDMTVGAGYGVSTPAPGDLAFFRQTYIDPFQTITHVGIVSRVNPDGSVWMIDAPGARAAGDPPDMPNGQVREEPITGFWAAHLAGFSRVLPPAANQP